MDDAIDGSNNNNCTTKQSSVVVLAMQDVVVGDVRQTRFLIFVHGALTKQFQRILKYFNWLGIYTEVHHQEEFSSKSSTGSDDEVSFVVINDLNTSKVFLPKHNSSQMIFVLPLNSTDEQNRIYQIPHPVITISPSDDISLLHGVAKSRIGALISNFLSAIHSETHTIILTRHGQSESNLNLRVGGNSALTLLGVRHANALAQFLSENKSEWIKNGLEVWSSHLKRARSSCEPLEKFLPCKFTTALNEINSGEFEGYSYSEIEEKHPTEFAARQKDKLRYRYPGGESYLDVIERLQPIILESERSRNPILILSHQGVLRAIYGYFRGSKLEEIPHLEIPTETLVVLTLQAGECTEERIRIQY